MRAYDLIRKEAYALKAILLVNEASTMVKIVEFYVKPETCVSDDVPGRSLTVTGGVADATYRLMVGDKSVMEGVSGASIRRDIGKREPDRPVTLITCYQDIDISGRSLTEFLLPILGAGEIGRRVESSINMFASEKVWFSVANSVDETHLRSSARAGITSDVHVIGDRMKRFVNLVDETASGIIGIVVAGLVVSGVLLYIAFGSKFDID